MRGRVNPRGKLTRTTAVPILFSLLANKTPATATNWTKAVPPMVMPNSGSLGSDILTMFWMRKPSMKKKLNLMRATLICKTSMSTYAQKQDKIDSVHLLRG